MSLRFRLTGACAVVLLAGCGSWGRVGSQPGTKPGETLAQVLDLTAVYRKLGRLTAGAPLPFVADVAFLAGAGDSTVAIIGLSLENRALAFQRDGEGFAARYRVQLSAEPAAGGPVIQRTKDQVVRVTAFPETQRNDESILYQDGITLPPGSWRISLQLTDQVAGLSKTSRATALYTVPAYTPGTVSPPYLAYQSRGRGTRTAPIGLILNPRGSLAYGGDTATAYVEAYMMPGPTAVPIVLLDARDSVILVDTLRFVGGREVESAALRFAPDSAPLGELRIRQGIGAAAESTTAIVSFSSNWVVTNFEDMVALLRYFPDSPELDSLRKAPVADRSRRWKAFWRASDPNQATPSNERLDRYFKLLAIANQRYRDEGVPGWRTDRGEVLIRLGDADEVFDASPQSQGRLIRWSYTQYQLVIYFVDESGFGRFRLTPASRSEFERVYARVSRQAE
ncbi:MAG: GWxTD domain-containing protein [Gemmatimonadota bacterium]|nr:GWxTD domain-containing protein [Gemmatimonadota bacterium]